MSVLGRLKPSQVLDMDYKGHVEPPAVVIQSSRGPLTQIQKPTVSTTTKPLS